MKELKDNELNTVNGGDNGDMEKEKSDTADGIKYLYNVGDHVEVYLSGIHNCTRGGIIIDRFPKFRMVGCSFGFIGMYKVQLDDGGYDTVNADQIESS